jgi:hypothetical protein
MAVNDFILNCVIGSEKLLQNPTFAWKGETFGCVPNTLNDTLKSGEAGFDEESDFRMTVRLNQFTPNIYPSINDYVIYLGYKLLIIGIRKPAHGVFWIYICELPKVN